MKFYEATLIPNYIRGGWGEERERERERKQDNMRETA
jgi:hypothetical protein